MTTKELADKWRVSLRVAQKMIADGVPLEDEAATVRWFDSLPQRTRAKFTDSFQSRIEEVRRGAPSGAEPKPEVDPDYAEFQLKHAAPGQGQERVAELKRLCAFATFKIEKGLARGNLGEVKNATEQLRHISGVVHDEELRAYKLGREVGDIIQRPEAERFFRAVPYWLIRGVDDLTAELIKRIGAAIAMGPVTEEGWRKVIEPALLSDRVLTPFARAAQVDAGVCLPTWAVAAMKDAMACTLEDGAAEFSKLYAKPAN